MRTAQELRELMFSASKLVDNSQQPAKYRVRGYPENNGNGIDYANFSRDFTFASYEKVIAGGLLRCQRIFNKPYSDIEVHKMNYGRNKQWFICELISRGTKVKVDGELHYPYLCINYSYDRVNAINYEIGIYREKCVNGVLFGFRSLMKIKVTPETIFDVDPWYNPCLLHNLVKEYERQVQMLKRTHMDQRSMESLISVALGRDIRHEEDTYFVDRKGELSTQPNVQRMMRNYTNELGENAYATLNVITDIASNYREGLELSDSINNSRTAAQRKAGKWLDDLITFIERENEVLLNTSIESEHFGSKEQRETYDFNLEAYLRFIRSSN